MKILMSAIAILLLTSCGWRKGKKAPLPRCLVQRIDSLSKINERPISITRYDFRNQIVYYMKAACCDRFNIVFDADCNILGFPDGGYTGKGDGSLPGFRDSAKNPIVVWRINED